MPVAGTLLFSIFSSIMVLKLSNFELYILIFFSYLYFSGLILLSIVLQQHPYCLANADLLIFSSGFTLENCVKAAKQLEIENHILANVINVVNLKNFSQYAPILITSDAPIMMVYNGSPQVLSQYVANSIVSNSDIPRPKAFLSHGFEIGTTGKMNDLVNYYGFDEESIKEKSLKLVKSKR